MRPDCARLPFRAPILPATFFGRSKRGRDSEFGEYIREGKIVPMEVTVALLENAIARGDWQDWDQEVFD